MEQRQNFLWKTGAKGSISGIGEYNWGERMWEKDLGPMRERGRGEKERSEKGGGPWD